MPPVNSASGNLAKSVFEKENGLEEAVFRRADHRLFAAGGSRHTGQGTVSATWSVMDSSTTDDQCFADGGLAAQSQDAGDRSFRSGMPVQQP